MSYTKFLTAAAAAFSLFASSMATYDPASRSNVAMYWGSGFNQSDLRRYCDESTVDIIPIGFVNAFLPQGNGLVGENFGNQCWASNYFGKGYNGQAPNHDNDLLPKHCPSLQRDLIYCRANTDKKFLLSLGGSSGPYAVSSVQEGQDLADFLWGAYGPYSSDWKGLRPLDGGATDDPNLHFDFDGFDFDIETPSSDGQAGYIACIVRLRQHFADHKKAFPCSKDYIISGAPQCPLPEGNMGNMIARAQFDILFIQLYNNDAYGCSARNFTDQGVSSNFNFGPGTLFAQTTSWTSTIATGLSKDAKLYLGLLGGPSASLTPNDWLKPAEAKALIQSYANTKNFGGVMLYEATAAAAVDMSPYTGVTSAPSYWAAMKEFLKPYAPLTVTSSTCSSTSSTSSTSSSSSSSSTSTSTTTTTTSSSSSSTTSTSTSATPTSTSSVVTPTSTSSSSSTSTTSSSTKSSSSSSTSPATSSSSTSSSSSSSSSTTTSSSSSSTTSSSSTSSTSSVQTTSSTSSISVPTTSSTSSVGTTSSSPSSVSTTSSSSAGVTPSSSSSVPATTSSTSSSVHYSNTTFSVSVSTSSSAGLTTTTSLPITTSAVVTPTAPTTTLYTTSTVVTTSVYTITSCAPTVSNCPIGSVTTDVITLYTTVCPVTPTSTDTGYTYTSMAAAPTTTQYTTSTVYTTISYTITSCAPAVTNCPARLGSVTTEVVALYTTVCPVTAVPTPVAGIKLVGLSSEVSTTTLSATTTLYKTVLMIKSTATVVPVSAPYPTGSPSGLPAGTGLPSAGLPSVSLFVKVPVTTTAAGVVSQTPVPTTSFKGAASNVQSGMFGLVIVIAAAVLLI